MSYTPPTTAFVFAPHAPRPTPRNVVPHHPTPWCLRLHGHVTRPTMPRHITPPDTIF
ncbi:hypothetical protein FA95DRAFT_1614077 [Auriscalpium vulgare]|uniref:Uncharacterized protein n=1 Tax=Auriscalpium vulgare TaxID=40419 RepID=A0ACB8R0G2_9AGAM|nr:hypothetical protein FA95DRAFT_1614077 [Auriscalpium vulgare]